MQTPLDSGARVEAGAHEPLVLWGKGITVRAKERKLLDNVTIAAKGGCVTGILGSSGAGKTTLLNVLLGRTQVESGTIGLNNISGIPERVTKLLFSYVLATDRLNEFLTIEETLYSAAQLKLPHLTVAEQREKADELISLLHLESCRNVLVGGSWRKGISKGQMKRVCIAQDLLGDPLVLVLDEPTTGLDSFLAYELMEILQKVARARHTVILCTIHQPNRRVINMIDQAILLRAGRIVYNGSPDRSMEFWDSLGCVGVWQTVERRMYSPLTNPHHSHASKPLTGHTDTNHRFSHAPSPSSPDIESSPSKKLLDHDAASYQLLDESHVSNLHSVSEGDTSFNSALYEEEVVDLIERSRRTIVDVETRINEIQTAVSWMNQFIVSFMRSLVSAYRNPLTVILILLVNVVQAFLLGALFFNMQSDTASITLGSYLDWDIWDSSVMKYLNEGIDLKGYVDGVRNDPLRDFMEEGVDDKSLAFDILGSQDLVNWLVDMSMCFRQVFPLQYDLPSYPTWNWMPNGGNITVTTTTTSATTSAATSGEDSLIEGLLKDLSGLAGGAVLLENETERIKLATVEGELEGDLATMSVEQFVSAALSLTQALDMVMQSKSTWSNPPLEIYGQSVLEFWLTFPVAAQAYATTLLCCAGNRYGLDTGLNAKVVCADVYPNVTFPQFPGASLTKVVRKSRSLLRSLFANPEVVHAATMAYYQFAYVEGDGSQDGTRSRAQDGSVFSNKAAKRRQLGSGLGGMITDVYQLIFNNPDNPLGTMALSIQNIVGKIKSDSCIGHFCPALRTATDKIAELLDDASNTILTAVNICGTVFFLIANLGFASYDILLQFPKERAVFNRDRASGLYRTSSYLAGKMIAELPFQVIPGLVWACIYWLMTGMNADAHTMVLYLAVAMLVTFTAYSMGYFVSAACLRLETAIVVSPLILVCMLVLSGFFLRDASMPLWLSWAKYFSIYRWAYFAVILIQFPPGKSFGIFPSSLVHTLAGVTNPNLYQSLLYLLAMSFICRVATYFTLRFFHTHQGMES